MMYREYEESIIAMIYFLLILWTMVMWIDVFQHRERIVWAIVFTILVALMIFLNEKNSDYT